MSDADKPTAEAGATKQRKSRRTGGASMKAGADSVRSKIASAVWLVAVVCALFLAVGALLVALKANPDNSIVEFVLAGAHRLEGPFADLFAFDGRNAETKDALVNWGIAAVVYLLVGKVLDRIIRP